MPLTISGPHLGTSSLCTPILRALPDWFGLEAAILQYASEIDALPTFLATREEDTLGFLSLKQHFPFAAEVYVMGVRAEAQRQGLGRGLVEAAQAWLRAQGVEYLQVKTLGPSRPDPSYAKTRAFYGALGFCPLEEFKQIWDEQNPCLILIKRLPVEKPFTAETRRDAEYR
jgi:GNAT superfamily N-acetyltransferase